MKLHFWETEYTKSLFYQPFANWEKSSDWNEDIPQYFKRLNKLRDERSFVILASTVLEYQVDRFLKCFIPEFQILITDNTSFGSKLKILRAFRIIPPHIINCTELIKNIRNEFAHNQALDKFSDTKKSNKLIAHLQLLDKYWKDYEDDMLYFKIKQDTLQKFKDIWRKALEGFRSYENNIKLFRLITEQKEFIDSLKDKSKKMETIRIKKEGREIVDSFIHGHRGSRKFNSNSENQLR
jgi:hypothetical protein